MTLHLPKGVAGTALDAVATLSVSAQRAIGAGLYAPLRVRMAQLLRVEDPWRPEHPDARLDDLAAWPTSAVFSAAERASLVLAEQFQLDVSAVTDDQRHTLRAALGDQAPVVVDVLHAIDVELRVRAAGQELFGIDVLGRAVAAPHTDLPVALNLVTREVARLDVLDPLTTELVRLRGARVHDCRMCRSLRHVEALRAGGDEDLFDHIDTYESGGLSLRHVRALRLVDAILFRPGDFPPDLVDELCASFSAEEALEVVLDVERNARNKVAVANGTDGNGVGEGLAVYDTPDGGFELVSGGPGLVDPAAGFREG